VPEVGERCGNPIPMRCPPPLIVGVAVFAGLSALPLLGQSQGDEDAIKQLIIDLSQWMRSGDASAIELSMEPRVRLTTYDGGVINGPKSVASCLSGGFSPIPKT
jgi:hypothetical protein